MIWRLMLLALLVAGIWGGWWGLTVGHRVRLRQRVSAEPYSAMVFTSPQCAACRTQERIVASLPPEEAQRIRSVDVNRYPEEAARFGVMTIPTTVFFGSDGTVAGVSYGVIDAADFKRILRVTGADRRPSTA